MYVVYVWARNCNSLHYQTNNNAHEIIYYILNILLYLCGMSSAWHCSLLNFLFFFSNILF